MKVYLTRAEQKKMTPVRLAWWHRLSYDEIIIRIRIYRSERRIKGYKAILSDAGWDAIPLLGIRTERKRIKELKAQLPQYKK